MNLTTLKMALDTKELFSHFTDVPWSAEVLPAPLNLVYSTRSNNKYIAPLLSNYLSDTKLHLTDEDLNSVALALQAIFGINWKKLWDAINAEYNITDNYDITTEYHETGTVNDSGGVENTGTTTTNIQYDTNDSVYGFNSIEASNSDKSESTTTNTVTDNTNQARTNDRTIGTDYTSRKHGNIGVMVYPSMLKAEIDARRWNFFEQVFADIDSLLTLSVY